MCEVVYEVTWPAKQRDWMGWYISDRTVEPIRGEVEGWLVSEDRFMSPDPFFSWSHST